MTTFPELEAALDAAAHRHYGAPAPVLGRASPVPALALACALAALMALPVRTGARALQRPRRRGSPRRPLALSHAPWRSAPDAPAAAAPRPARLRTPSCRRSPRRSRSARPTRRGRATASTGSRRPPGRHDMASINFRVDIQGLVEFRAACLWMRYWLASASDAAARQAAAGARRRARLAFPARQPGQLGRGPRRGGRKRPRRPRSPEPGRLLALARPPGPLATGAAPRYASSTGSLRTHPIQTPCSVASGVSGTS